MQSRLYGPKRSIYDIDAIGKAGYGVLHYQSKPKGEIMSTVSKGTALITGASGGLGAIYADRLAKRGYDLILVARDRERLADLARRITDETGRSVTVLAADLGDKADLARVEETLRSDASITMLVNNAGVGAAAPLIHSDVDKMEEMITLNVTALMRLSYAVVPAFVQRDTGTIINIASIVAIWPEILNGVYAGSKAFVSAFSQSLQNELVDKNVRVHLVIPGATATGFWDAAGYAVTNLPAEAVMDSEDMVDAALAGLDMGEPITIPSLPEVAAWHAYEAARKKLIPSLSRKVPANRYRD
jgi:short-subunit dehydrogenase